MTTTLSLPRVATALREPALDTLRLATCPLCHAKRVASTQEPLETDEDWRCARCGQRWDAPRLAAVAAYAEGVARRESARDAGAASHDTGRPAHVAPRTLRWRQARPLPDGTLRAALPNRRDVGRHNDTMTEGHHATHGGTQANDSRI